VLYKSECSITPDMTCRLLLDCWIVLLWLLLCSCFLDDPIHHLEYAVQHTFR
jgi:hypothetical protein